MVVLQITLQVPMNIPVAKSLLQLQVGFLTYQVVGHCHLHESVFATPFVELEKE